MRCEENLNIIRVIQFTRRSLEFIMQILGGQMSALFSTLFVFAMLMGCSNEYQEVSITIEEFRVTPNEIHLLPHQPIRLLIRNQGRELHRFASRVFSETWKMNGGEGEQPVVHLNEGLAIPPGKSVELILRLPSGLYEFRCPIRGHRGMVGRFVVQTAGSE